MHIIDLFEAPIGNLEVHGMDQPGTFSAADRRLLQSPTHVSKIKQRFAYTEVDFDLYFVNLPGRRFVAPTENGERFTDDQTTTMGNFAGYTTSETVWEQCHVRIAANPRTISVVFISNANIENTIPMTPWMIAHRFGHALTDSPHMLPANIRNEIYHLPLSTVTVDVGKRLPLPAVMTTRSARTNTIGIGEEREELIAQFLLQGSVRLALPDKYKTHPNAQGWQTNLHTEARQIDQTISDMLHACLGQMFMAV